MGVNSTPLHVLFYVDLANLVLIIISDLGPARFPYSERCIICNEDIRADERHPARQQTIHRASTITLKTSLLRMAIARKDSLGMAVQGRLEGMADLVAEEAVYHHKCYCTLYDVPGRRNVSKIARVCKSQLIIPLFSENWKARG